MNTRNIPFRKMAMLSAISAAGSIATTALAQEPAQTRETALEEVMVTAQKREESLQETPIAITALDTIQLEEINATSLQDLNGYIPAFAAPPFAADAAAPTVFIRGMGNVDIQTTKDQAVGVYLDGVVLGRATGLALDIADLERIEVLRGPQGTLYGRNNTAGAINYVTRKPDEEFGAKVRLTGGNYNRAGAQIDLNLPATDNLFFKIAYLADRQDGWIENENVNNLPDQIDPWQRNNQAATAAVRWYAADTFTFDLGIDYSDLEYGNAYYQVVQASAAPPGVLNFSTVKPTHDRRDKADLAKGLSPSTVRTGGANLTLTWDLGSVTLKSITGYRELDGDLFQNYLDGLSYVSSDPVNIQAPASEFIQTNRVEQWQVSQEFQAIGSALEDRVQYVLGLYYYKEEATEDQVSDFGLPAGAPGGPFPVLETWDVDSESESRAIYGQATWHPDILAQRLGLTLGLRYTEDDRKATKNYGLLFGAPLNTSVDAKDDFSNTSGTFIVDYAFTDNVNSYAKYATGYRAGGFSTRARIADFANGFDPEEVQSFELGLKSRLWEQRLSLNVAAYYNQYDDLQVANFEPPVFNNTINAGDATIKGAEVELIARLSRAWTVDAFYAFIDADYGEYIAPDFDGNFFDQSDIKKVPNAPRNQAKLGVEYAAPMTDIGQFTIKLDYLWTDEFWSSPDSTNRNDAYGLLNGRIQWLGIPLPKGNIRVALWGKNLTDKEYTVLTTDFSGGDNNPFDAFRTLASMYGMPRTYGIDFIYEY